MDAGRGQSQMEGNNRMNNLMPHKASASLLRLVCQNGDVVTVRWSAMVVSTGAPVDTRKV